MRMAVCFFEELEGFVTYKLYAEFANSTDELSAIYSDVEVLGNPPIYVDAPCGCFNPDLGDVLLGGLQNPALFTFLPDVQYDTYWTLGFAQGEQAILSNTAYNSTTMCSEFEEGGLFFTPFAEAAGDDLRIQFAQITTCRSFRVNGLFPSFR